MLHVAISKEKEFEAEGGFVVGEEKEVFLTVYEKEKEEEKESKNKREVESELAYYTIFRNVKINQPGILLFSFLLFSLAFLSSYFLLLIRLRFRGCFFDF